MKKSLSITLMLMCTLGFAQQQVSIKINPTHTRGIEGHKELDRSKYFNLAANVNEMKKVLTPEQETEYLDNLDMTLGRRLGLVFSEKRWGNSIQEDPNRPGYIDVEYFINKQNPNDNGLEAYKAKYGSKQGLALHDRHNAYPDFMDLYIPDGSDQAMPGNIDAAAELAALALKYTFTDFQRPDFYEIVNEPDWRFGGEQRFYDLHTAVNDKVDELGLDVKVGGPCNSVSYYYRREYDRLTNFTDFIDGTNAELDFYSFHTYDYMGWDGNDFVGSISSGLPLEGVFDGIAAFMHNKYGKEFKFVGSEHGAYFTDAAKKEEVYEELGSQYFPGSGFEYEMEKRNIDNFIMVNGAIANTLTFMNSPHIVEKAVPFILLESSGWDPKYYSSLLVKENFQKSSSKWVESRLIDYFKFFKDVKGRRVEFWNDDPDIQSFAFVNDHQLIVVLHNQSNTEANVNLEVDEFSGKVKDVLVRTLGRKVDFRPEFKEETYATLPEVTLTAQGSGVVFVNYESSIPEEEDLDEKVYYSTTWGQTFTGSKDFVINIDDLQQVRSATLRVGVSRNKDNPKDVEITLNGSKLNVQLEDCAERITGDDYATTKIIHVNPALVKAENKVTVNFPDGKSGGVGSAVLRVTYGEPIATSEVLGSSPSGSFVIYPNPGKDTFEVKANEVGSIKVYDAKGALLLEQPAVAGVNKVKHNLNKGVYMVNFVSQRNDAISRQKLIVQ
ncbi:T9SS type A sorting domain-containing protein [Marinoscillum furvescens]|uniref:Putative secreted protein (Por secretion system target) n=1 Tax=Marinoscillum furvescens DSM 4134 TaxID=1122208 RepID=A0A3D9KZK4_MARFU|nr:T9SS type A sorting domain-containing protein [Marinoscillum furvescens]RED95997.1 putative secreted protein (Por secretion system target) [Marinoscillum furvescens DSM 4134]